MKYILFITFGLVCLCTSSVVFAQVDTSTVKKDSLAVDSVKIADSAAVKVNADTVMATTPPANCYKQWTDVFAELGTKPLTDGSHPVVLAIKKKDECSCYMGKVEVVGGKIKAPLLIQTEGGTFKTFTEMGKKLDSDFLEATGDGLWAITNGMSVVFQTVDQEYCRVFFYKSLNKNKQMSKEAPSPQELLKN